MRKKNYLWYMFWRHTVVGNGLKFFYSKVKTQGLENIPKDKPILFVPNHQNSFMDALVVAKTAKPVIYFLTRAKAFKPEIIGKFLWSINMMPVYRVRDGMSSVQKNNDIFDKCIHYLKNKDAILVFAEANHNLKRRIRSLSKGFTRIAFGSEEKFDWSLDVQIVPVGVNYTKHEDSQNIVNVVYGECIPVSKYKDLYLEDENAAAQEMKDDVSDAMKKLVFHVEDLHKYPAQKILWEVLEGDQYVLTNPTISNERIQKADEHLTEELQEEAKELVDLADKKNFSLKSIALGKKLRTSDVLLFPVYLFAFINNIIPYQPGNYLVNNVIRDHAFDASMKFLTGLFAMPIFYLIICAVLAISGVDGSYILGYFLFSALTAPMFIRAKELLLPSSAQQLKRKNPDLYQKVETKLKSFKDLRASILSE